SRCDGRLSPGLYPCSAINLRMARRADSGTASEVCGITVQASQSSKNPFYPHLEHSASDAQHWGGKALKRAKAGREAARLV
ncbi:Unknown protein sequence, partial [Pseudomonas syringae pv. coryli]